MKLLNGNCLFFKYPLVIFADELGVFWRTSLGRTMTKKQLEGNSNSCNMLNYLSCVNSDGMEKTIK